MHIRLCNQVGQQACPSDHKRLLCCIRDVLIYHSYEAIVNVVPQVSTRVAFL